MGQKLKIRTLARKLRKKMDDEQLDQAADFIADRLDKIPAFHRALNIGVYWDIDNEIRTQPLLDLCEKHKKNIYLPKAIKMTKRLLFLPYEKNTQMTKDELHIPCPITDKDAITPSDLDMAIIPIVACNATKHRIGFGGGFYDRSFAKTSRCFLIGVGYDFQQFDEFEPNQHDLQMHELILAPTNVDPYSSTTDQELLSD